MEDALISFETAKLAKEKGLNISTRHFYADESWKSKQIYSCSEVGYPEYTNDMMDNNHGFGDIILIPTQSLLAKWLREVHGINVSSDLWDYLGKKQIPTWQYNILKIDPISNFIKSHKPKIGLKYEEALEIGLQEALKLIK